MGCPIYPGHSWKQGHQTYKQYCDDLDKLGLQYSWVQQFIRKQQMRKRYNQIFIDRLYVQQFGQQVQHKTY